MPAQTFGPSTAIADTSLAQDVPTANFGALNFIRVSHAATAVRVNGLLSWPISLIPPGSIVIAAILALKTTATSLVSNQPAHAYPLTKPFTQGTETGGTANSGATFNKYNSAAEGGNNWDTPGGDYDPAFGSAFILPNTVRDVLADVTTAISAGLKFYRFAGRVGLLLRQDVDLIATGQTCDFHSNNAASSANWPRLTIVYLPPPVLDHRRPTISIRRRHDVEPSLQVAMYADLTRAANGDGLPGNGTVDYATPRTSGIPLWPAGQRTMYGGGFCRRRFARPAAMPAAGFGFASGGFAASPYCSPIPPFTWQVPFPLRDGNYVFGIRLSDRLGHEATSPVMELALSVAALPRPVSEARLVSYDAGSKIMAVAWNASPDVEVI